MTERIAFVDLKAQYARLGPRIAARVRAVLDHGQYILGPEVDELETALARFTGASHAIGVSSGTDALVIALLAEEVGRGDAVFVPGFTFHATAEAVAAVGATPVFCDVDPRTFNLDAADFSRRLEEVAAAGALRPRAVIPVDLFGLPADYDAVGAIAAEHGLLVLADAAQSLGATLGGARVGRLAPVTATSFYPTKPLGAYGDGGALFTDDARRAELVRSIRVHGAGRDGASERLGMNGRLDTLQAAVLLAKLDALEEEVEARELVARRYDELLADRVAVPARVPDASSAWAVYSILVDDRDAVIDALTSRGIPTRIYYRTPVHLHPAFRPFGEGPGSLPVAEALSARILSLPMHPYLDHDAVARICAAVAAAVR